MANNVIVYLSPFSTRINQELANYSQPVFIVFIVRPPCPFAYVLSVAAFTLQRLSWLVGTEAKYAAKPKLLTTWLFMNKFPTLGIDQPPLSS